MIIITSAGKMIREFLESILAPKFTVYQWSNMTEKQKSSFKKQQKEMLKSFEDMLSEFKKDIDKL